MSERLPYEDHLQQRWNDLPLPDENKAWEDMKRRLEEEDDDRPIIAWWRRGCLLWGFLLLVIFGSGLWLIKERYFSSGDKKQETISKQEKGPDNKGTDTVTIQTIPSNTGSAISQERTKDETGPLKEITGQQNTEPENNSPLIADPGIEVPVSQTDKVQRKETIRSGTGIENPVVTGRRSRKNRVNTVVVKKENTISNPIVTGRRRNVNNRTPKADTYAQPVKKPIRPVTTLPSKVENGIAEDIPLKTNDVPANGRADSLSLIPKKDTLASKPSGKKDSIVSIPPLKKDSLGTNAAKKDSVKKKQPITFSAGLAMQQLLPVAGQKAVPYNSQGRKGTLADYIPSVYFRVNKERKWFVQGEFKYGAPQLTKEFVFGQSEDTAGQQGNAIRTTNTLKKTYYHQLPVTFNYFITKDWSIGAGFTWNKFVKAIVDNEVVRHNISTSRDSLLTKGIVSYKEDTASNFSKSYFQGVIESQYKWKRFSFGARYSFGLQPYIKFTLLNGETGQERNSSLNVFLRYELWRSKKKE